MHLRWIILPVFLVFAEAENVTEVKAKLGQNAILTCSGKTTDTYWYIKISSQVKGLIARTYSMDPNDTLYYIHPETTYIAKGNTLEITNITAEDCRLYFCAKKEGGNMTFRDTFHLVTDDPITPRNNQEQQNSCIMCQNDVVYSSLAVNILLILVIIGLVFTLLFLKRNNCDHQGTEPSSFTCENPETLETPQYEEIQLRNVMPAVSDCIYYKVQLPQSTLRPPHP
ncbi:uncharacterized protein LOC144513730 [Sander vitreus]